MGRVNEFEAGSIHELHLGDEDVVVLADRVVELFKSSTIRSDQIYRFHVSHVRLELKPKRKGEHSLRFSVPYKGSFLEANRVVVPPGSLEDAQRFIELVEREAGRRTG